MPVPSKNNTANFNAATKKALGSRTTDGEWSGCLKARPALMRKLGYLWRIRDDYQTWKKYDERNDLCVNCDDLVHDSSKDTRS